MTQHDGAWYDRMYNNRILQIGVKLRRRYATATVAFKTWPMAVA
jgi:hypothetical protein